MAIITIIDQDAVGGGGGNGTQGPTGNTGPQGPQGPTGNTGPAPSGTGFVRVTSGVLETPSNSVTATPSIETRTSPSISANTLTIDCNAGNVFTINLNSSISTLNISNTPATGNAFGLTLAFTADGTARSITWGNSVKWPYGSNPTPTSANGKIDIITLTTWDGGNTWFAGIAGQNY